MLFARPKLFASRETKLDLRAQIDDKRHFIETASQSSEQTHKQTHITHLAASRACIASRSAMRAVAVLRRNCASAAIAKQSSIATPTSGLRNVADRPRCDFRSALQELLAQSCKELRSSPETEARTAVARRLRIAAQSRSSRLLSSCAVLAFVGATQLKRFDDRNNSCEL